MISKNCKKFHCYVLNGNFSQWVMPPVYKEPVAYPDPHYTPYSRSLSPETVHRLLLSAIQTHTHTRPETFSKTLDHCPYLLQWHQYRRIKHWGKTFKNNYTYRTWIDIYKKMSFKSKEKIIFISSIHHTNNINNNWFFFLETGPNI